MRQSLGSAAAPDQGNWVEPIQPGQCAWLGGWQDYKNDCKQKRRRNLAREKKTRKILWRSDSDSAVWTVRINQENQTERPRLTEDWEWPSERAGNQEVNSAVLWRNGWQLRKRGTQLQNLGVWNQHWHSTPVETREVTHCNLYSRALHNYVGFITRSP